MNETNTVSVMIDPIGQTFEIDPYGFPPIVTGMVAGAFLSYWKHAKVLSLAEDLIHRMNDQHVSEYWSQTVTDIVEVGEKLVEFTDDDEFTLNTFLTWVKDAMTNRFEENL